MPINPEVIDESHLIPPTFADDVESNEPTRTCEACSQFVGQNPLVKRGLIPPSLADVLVPPPVKPVTEKRRLSKCVTGGRVISGDEMLQVLKEREAAEVRKQEEKKRREEEKELRQKKKMIEDEMKATKRQKKQDEIIQREKEKENEKERMEKYGKLAEKKYTCGVCGVRGRVNDEVYGIEWYGCDNDMCKSTGWFHFDCLSECERDALRESIEGEDVCWYCKVCFPRLYEEE